MMQSEEALQSPGVATQPSPCFLCNQNFVRPTKQYQRHYIHEPAELKELQDMFFRIFELPEDQKTKVSLLNIPDSCPFCLKCGQNARNLVKLQNNLDQLEAKVKKAKDDIASVIVSTHCKDESEMDQDQEQNPNLQLALLIYNKWCPKPEVPNKESANQEQSTKAVLAMESRKQLESAKADVSMESRDQLESTKVEVSMESRKQEESKSTQVINGASENMFSTKPQPHRLSRDLISITKRDEADKFLLSLNTDDSEEVTCQICSKVCRSKEILEVHSRTHENTKVTCSFCGKSFSKATALKKHWQYHRGDHPPIPPNEQIMEPVKKDAGKTKTKAVLAEKPVAEELQVKMEVNESRDNAPTPDPEPVEVEAESEPKIVRKRRMSERRKSVVAEISKPDVPVAAEELQVNMNGNESTESVPETEPVAVDAESEPKIVRKRRMSERRKSVVAEISIPDVPVDPLPPKLLDQTRISIVGGTYAETETEGDEYIVEDETGGDEDTAEPEAETEDDEVLEYANGLDEYEGYTEAEDGEFSDAEDSMEMEVDPMIDPSMFESEVNKFKYTAKSKVTGQQCKMCLKDYASTSTLRKHVQIVHLKQKRLVCPICTISCGDHYTLTKHVLRHDPALTRVVFNCTECGLGVMTRRGFDRHYRKNHPDAKLPKHPLVRALTNNDPMDIEVETEIPAEPVLESLAQEDEINAISSVVPEVASYISDFASASHMPSEPIAGLITLEEATAAAAPVTKLYPKKKKKPKSVFLYKRKRRNWKNRGKAKRQSNLEIKTEPEFEDDPMAVSLGPVAGVESIETDKYLIKEAQEKNSVIKLFNFNTSLVIDRVDETLIRPNNAAFPAVLNSEVRATDNVAKKQARNPKNKPTAASASAPEVVPPVVLSRRPADWKSQDVWFTQQKSTTLSALTQSAMSVSDTDRAPPLPTADSATWKKSFRPYSSQIRNPTTTDVTAPKPNPGLNPIPSTTASSKPGPKNLSSQIVTSSNNIRPKTPVKILPAPATSSNIIVARPKTPVKILPAIPSSNIVVLPKTPVKMLPVTPINNIVLRPKTPVKLQLATPSDNTVVRPKTPVKILPAPPKQTSSEGNKSGYWADPSNILIGAPSTSSPSFLQGMGNKKQSSSGGPGSPTKIKKLADIAKSLKQILPKAHPSATNKTTLQSNTTKLVRTLKKSGIGSINVVPFGKGNGNSTLEFPGEPGMDRFETVSVPSSSQDGAFRPPAVQYNYTHTSNEEEDEYIDPSQFLQVESGGSDEHQDVGRHLLQGGDRAFQNDIQALLRNPKINVSMVPDTSKATPTIPEKIITTSTMRSTLPSGIKLVPVEDVLKGKVRERETDPLASPPAKKRLVLPKPAPNPGGVSFLSDFMTVVSNNTNMTKPSAPKSKPFVMGTPLSQIYDEMDHLDSEEVQERSESPPPIRIRSIQSLREPEPASFSEELVDDAEQYQPRFTAGNSRPSPKINISQVRSVQNPVPKNIIGATQVILPQIRPKPSPSSQVQARMGMRAAAQGQSPMHPAPQQFQQVRARPPRAFINRKYRADEQKGVMKYSDYLRTRLAAPNEHQQIGSAGDSNFNLPIRTSPSLQRASPAAVQLQPATPSTTSNGSNVVYMLVPAGTSPSNAQTMVMNSIASMRNTASPMLRQVNPQPQTDDDQFVNFQ